MPPICTSSLHPSTTRPLSLVLLTHSPAAFGDKRGRKGGRLDDDIDRPSFRPTMQTTFTVPTHYVARLSSSSADEDGIDCRRCCCKTVKTTNCGLERVRGKGKKRKETFASPLPFPSAVKYIQEAFECVCCIESREGRGGQTRCALYWKGNKEVKQEGEISLHLCLPCQAKRIEYAHPEHCCRKTFGTNISNLHRKQRIR